MAKASGPAIAIVLALLAASPILVGITPVAEATHVPGHFNQNTQGCLEVAAYPDYAFDTVTEPSAIAYAKPDTRNGYNLRTFRIANNCPFDVNEIRFLWYPREERPGRDVTAPPNSLTLYASETGTFNPADVGNPVYCTIEQPEATPPNPPPPPCPIQPETVIVAVSADGSQATISLPTTFALTAAYGGIDGGCNQPPYTYNPVAGVPGRNVDPCTEEASITWLAERSYARGWTTRHDNFAVRSRAAQYEEFGAVVDPYTRELVFKARTTEGIHRGTATCGDRTITDGIVTGGSTTLASAGQALFATSDEGKAISGPGIPPNTIIEDVIDANTAILSEAATSSTNPAVVVIGVPAPCSSTMLRQTGIDFAQLGVVAGMTLTVLPPHVAASGQTAGRHVITQVAGEDLYLAPPLTCSGCTSPSVTTGLQYIISAPDNVNATLLAGGSLALDSAMPRAQDFTIAFRVTGGSREGLMIPIQVIGYPALYPCMYRDSNPCAGGVPSVPYETTCVSTPNILWRCILPRDSVGVVQGCARTDPTTCVDQAPSLYLAMDDGSTVEPTIVSAVTRDSDSNGHIDRFEATFAKRIEPKSFQAAVDAGRFTIATRSRLAYDAGGQTCSDRSVPGDMLRPCSEYEIRGAFLTDLPFPGRGFSRATFMLREMPYYDTGDTPYIRYTTTIRNCAPQAPPSECGVRDLAGNTMRSITGTALTAADGAPPVMVGSWGREGFDQIDVFFSEPVAAKTPGGTNNCGFCTSNNTLTDPSQNFILDGVQPGQRLRILNSNRAGTYTVSGVTATTITFTPPAPNNTLIGDRFAVEVEELTIGHFAFFDDLGPKTNLPNPCNAVDSLDDLIPVLALADDRPITRDLPASGWHYYFQTKEDVPNNPGRSIKLGPCDVHPLSGDLLGPRLDNRGVPLIRDLTGLPLAFIDRSYVQGVVAGCTVPPAAPNCNTNTLFDTNVGSFVARGITAGMQLHIIDGPAKGTYSVQAVNPTSVTFQPLAPAPMQNGDPYWITTYVNKTWPSGGVEVRPSGSSRHITYPLVIRADMDISHDMVRVLFNGPVRYPRPDERLNRSDTPVTHADMDIASATGTGQGPQGFVRSYFARADVDTIYLKADHPARPQDVDNSPSLFKIHCNKIQGTRLKEDTSVGTTPGKSSFVPCDDPDRFYGWDSDPTGRILKPDVSIVDITPPRIIEAKTSDANRDGWIDGVELRFSEPVNDASFCQLRDTEPDFCPDADQFVAGMVRFRDPWSPNREQRETRSKPMWEVSPKGGFHWETGLLQNDNVGILQLVNTTYDANGVPVRRIRNFEEDYNAWSCTEPTSGSQCVIDSARQIADLWRNGRSVFHRNKLQSDYLPHLSIDTRGLFADLTQQPVPLIPPNLLPDYCEIVSTSAYPGFSVPTVNKGGAGRCDIYADRTQAALHTVTIKDGAPPVIWKAETYDKPYFDRDHCAEKDKCHADRCPGTVPFCFRNPFQSILYGNGTIDGYRLTFSEPIHDHTFDRRDWHVEGYEPASGNHNVTGAVTSDPLAVDRLLGIRANDNQLILVFNETKRLNWFRQTGALTGSYTSADLNEFGWPVPNILTPEGGMVPGTTYRAQVELGPDGRPIPVPDTASRPELTYAPTSGGLRDHAGNVMRAITKTDLTESDGAAPVIVSVGGFVGEEKLFIKFSEPVDGGGRDALVRDDFNYYDVDQRGVAGKSSTKEVCHGDNDYIALKEAGCTPQPLDLAIVPLGGTLTDGDRARDTVAAVAGMIREIAPSVPAALRQAVPDVKVPLSDAKDSTPPGPIRDLRVEEALTDAGSVTLTWVAPGDDGLGGGPVLSYNVRVGQGSPLAGFASDGDFATSVLNPTGVELEYDPEPKANANHTQTVLVKGLLPNTTYYFMVQAIDHDSNVGPVSSQISTQTTRDVTGPECLNQAGTQTVPCPLVITSTDCAKGRVIQLRSDNKPECTFTWTPARDLQSPRSLTYRYRVSEQELDRVLTTDSATKGTSADIDFDRNGTFWVHVSAFSGGGYTPTAHYLVKVGAAGIDADELRAANDLVKTKPVRIESNGTYVNEVRWTLPDADELQEALPGATLVAVEIWRKEGNTFQLIERIRGTHAQLREGSYVDPLGSAKAEYRVQMVFAGDPEQAQANPQSGYVATEDLTPPGIPAWAWILIGVGLALIVAGVVIYMVLRAKQKEAAGSVAYAWEAANPDQIGIDEATGLPVHEVRCPSCNNPFQAIGNLPLPVTCPNCGTTGTLD